MGTPVFIANQPTVTVENLQREHFTGFHPVIQSDHAYIHDGIGYNYPCSFTLGNVEAKGCIIVAPLDCYIHWRPTTISTTASAVSVSLYEAPTYTGGAALTGLVNHNRNEPDTPKMVLKDGTLTITDNGKLLATASYGAAGQPANRAGGSGGSDNEYVFKPGLEYLLLITNLTSTTTTVFADLFWYEEEDG
jgi:hypothetical protein